MITNTADLLIAAGNATKHAIMRTISVICVLLVIAGISWAIYATFVKPSVNPLKTTSQDAEQINNPQFNPQPHAFGCASLRVINYYREKP